MLIFICPRKGPPLFFAVAPGRNGSNPTLPGVFLFWGVKALKTVGPMLVFASKKSKIPGWKASFQRKGGGFFSGAVVK
jgi:hypothetical protein